MSVSIHYTQEPYKATATAYLVEEYNDERWATVKVIDGYTDLLTLFLHEDTVRQMAQQLAEVVAKFDAQVAEETEN